MIRAHLVFISPNCRMTMYKGMTSAIAGIILPVNIAATSVFMVLFVERANTYAAKVPNAREINVDVTAMIKLFIKTGNIPCLKKTS